MQRLLTIEQTMEKLNLKRSATYNLINKDPHFPAYRIGGALRVGEDELEDWVKKHRVKYD